jgi:Transient receptor potential (TRP) ion channel/ML-like domain
MFVSLSLSQSCAHFPLGPLPTYNFTGSSSIALPSSINVASKVPTLAYKIPDLESFAQLTLTDVNTGAVAACIQATLSNGWSTRQPAVAYTTGAFALFALFSALLHSLLPSTPLSPASFCNLPSIAPARFVDFILLFQQVSFTGFLHLNFPLAYRAFTLNFAWALGLFPNSRPIQNAIDRMRHLTGGSLQDGVQSPAAFVNRQLSPYNAPVPSGSSPSSFLAMANAAFLAANRTLMARDSSTDSSSGNGPPATVTTGDSDILPAGIPVYVNSLNIGTTDAFMSVFFTVLIGAVVGAGVLGIMHVVLTFMVTRLRGNKWAWADVMHAELQWFAVSNGIRYVRCLLVACCERHTYYSRRP